MLRCNVWHHENHGHDTTDATGGKLNNPATGAQGNETRKRSGTEDTK